MITVWEGCKSCYKFIFRKRHQNQTYEPQNTSASNGSERGIPQGGVVSHSYPIGGTNGNTHGSVQERYNQGVSPFEIENQEDEADGGSDDSDDEEGNEEYEDEDLEGQEA